MRFRLVIRAEDGRIELLSVGLDVVDIACEQACAKGNKGGAKLFVEEHDSKVGGRGIRHGKIDALFGQVESDANEGGLALLACGEADGNGGETRDLTGSNVAEQSMLLYVPGEICGADIVHVLCVEILRNLAAKADRGGGTVEEGERFSGERRLVQNV